MSIYRTIPTRKVRAPEKSYARTGWARHLVAADLIARGFDVGTGLANVVADCRVFSLRVGVQIAKYRDQHDGRRRYLADWRRGRYADVLALVDPDDGEVIYVDRRTRTPVDVHADRGDGVPGQNAKSQAASERGGTA
jgi:hypothetical protein